MTPYDEVKKLEGANHWMAWMLFVGTVCMLLGIAIGIPIGHKMPLDPMVQEHGVHVLWIEEAPGERLVIKIEPANDKAMKALQEHLGKFPAKLVRGIPQK